MPLIYLRASSPAAATDEASTVSEHSELQCRRTRSDSPNQMRFEMHKSLMACYTRNAIALQSKSAIASKKASIFQKFLSFFFQIFKKWKQQPVSDWQMTLLTSSKRSVFSGSPILLLLLLSLFLCFFWVCLATPRL